MPRACSSRLCGRHKQTGVASFSLSLVYSSNAQYTHSYCSIIALKELVCSCVFCFFSVLLSPPLLRYVFLKLFPRPRWMCEILSVEYVCRVRHYKAAFAFIYWKCRLCLASKAGARSMICDITNYLDANPGSVFNFLAVWCGNLIHLVHIFWEWTLQWSRRLVVQQEIEKIGIFTNSGIFNEVGRVDAFLWVLNV